MVIFDCNGVLVDGEPIANAVLADALARVGTSLSAETVASRVHGRRPADVFAAVERVTGKTLPPAFGAEVSAETVRRFRRELRPLPHVAHALTWLRGPKAVASSSPLDRIRAGLEVAGLIRYFDSRLFSASDVANGKPAPDLFRHLASRLDVDAASCIVIEDSVPGVAAAVAAGMTAIGFVGGNLTPGRLANDLVKAGARTVIADMRALKSAVADIRGW
jgi:HAD superfamily hydrolase (TIGR01509 family)